MMKHARGRLARCRTGRQAGFTMVELLIAMVVAGVIASSVYFVFRGQSRVFFVQESISHTQAELRFAMETIKADLKRTGFLSALNTAVDTANHLWCGNRPNPAITGIQAKNGTGFVHLPLENVNVAPDEIRILGAFTTSNTMYSESVTGNTIKISNDPFLSPNFPTTQTDWDRLFPKGTLLRILDASNFYQIQQISSTSFSGRTVTLNQINKNTQVGCGPKGVGRGLMVNPVEYIRYRIIDTSNSSNPGLCANSQAVLGRTTLIRENLAPDGTTVLATLPIADYIVDMQFSFMIDSALPGTAPNIAPDLNPYDDLGNATMLVVNANPERVRSVRVYLAARTSSETQGFGHRLRSTVSVAGLAGLSPLTSFNLDNDRSNACRVRTLVSEVQLRNFGLR